MEATENADDFPEIALMQTITSDLSAIATDISEFSIDQLLNDGIIRDFPIVGSIVKVGKIGLTIRDQLFLKKVLRFLYCLKDTSIEERQKFMFNLKKETFQKRVGEHLILWLDRMDNMQKPLLLGRIFKSYLLEYIDYTTFEKLATSLDRLKMYTLPYLEYYYTHSNSGKRIELDSLQDLSFCNLVSINLSIGAVMGGGGPLYPKNELGRLFLKFALGKST